MMFKRLLLENWKNFLKIEIELQRRMFLLGPNASGKSNLLDAIRFLRDIADPQGGFQNAVVSKRRGVSQLRSLHARRHSTVVVETQVDLDVDGLWSYRLEFTQDNQRRPMIQREVVKHGDITVLDRPDDADKQDESRLTQTHLEQVSSNKTFRQLQEFFARVHYLHIVPQLVREPERSIGRTGDPYGGDFLEQLARAKKPILTSRLDRISKSLRVAVPSLQEIQLLRDPATGVPHLRSLYAHWRKDAGWQSEDQLSDGTLRLFGLLWALLDGVHPLLLEEPELSLHPRLVRYLPTMMARLLRKNARQVFISTHSPDLLSDDGIGIEEILLLIPTAEGTDVMVASDLAEVRTLVESGVPLPDVVVPRTAPRGAEQLVMFGE